MQLRVDSHSSEHKRKCSVASVQWYGGVCSGGNFGISEAGKATKQRLQHHCQTSYYYIRYTPFVIVTIILPTVSVTTSDDM